MADSKTQKNDKPVVKKPNRIQRWWRETVGELRKVTWPTKRQVFINTVSVLIFCVVIGLIIWLCDFGLQSLATLIQRLRP